MLFDDLSVDLCDHITRVFAELFNDFTEFRVNGKTFTSVTYAGDTSSSRFLYAYTLITFDSDPELILVVLQVTWPSEWKRFRPIFHSINASARAR